MTHDTREVKDKYPSYKELDMDKYQRIVEAGNFDEMFNYGFDVGKTELHHQLQKAREEERERIVAGLNLDSMQKIAEANGRPDLASVYAGIHAEIISGITPPDPLPTQVTE